MEHESLKQRLVRLYLEAYVMMLKETGLIGTYYFRHYTQNEEWLESVDAYADELIGRNDYSFLNSPDEELRMYFAVLANEDINGYLEAILNADTNGNTDESDENDQEVAILYQ